MHFIMIRGFNIPVCKPAIIKKLFFVLSILKRIIFFCEEIVQNFIWSKNMVGSTQLGGWERHVVPEQNRLDRSVLLISLWFGKY